MMCLLSSSGGGGGGASFTSSPAAAAAAADSTTTATTTIAAAAATSASIGVLSDDNPSPLDSIADSPIDFGAEDEEEEEEDSGRGSSGDSDKENQGADVNHYNSGGSASTPSSILKRLLANPDEPARPEWARKTASAEAVAAAPLPSPRQPTNTTVNAEAAQIVRKRVRLTFCNMRQNIHDRKRRRGGPGRKKSTDQRRPSTAEVATAVASVASEADSATPIPVGETIRLPVPRNFEPLAASSTCSPMPCLSEVEEQLSPKEVEDECISKSDLEDATAAVDSRVKHPSPVLPSETSSILRSYLQSHGMSSTQRSTDDDDFDCDPLSVNADEMCSASLRAMRRNNCADAILDEEDRDSISRLSSTAAVAMLDADCEEEIALDTDVDEDDDGVSMADSAVSCSADSVASVSACSISVVDMFRDCPLDSFICYGCSRPYSGTNGLYSIDLKDNTMSMVCAHCKWWAERRIAARNCKYRAP